jgi:hypothetical protein
LYKGALLALKYLSLDFVDTDAAARIAAGYRPYALYRLSRDKLALASNSNFLRNFDRFRNGIENMIDMPERALNKLLGFLLQNQGRLSKRAKEAEFAKLTVDEISKIEQLFADSFGEDGAG